LESQVELKIDKLKSRYDRAMVGFLQCVNQVYNHIKALDPSFDLPYRFASPCPTNLQSIVEDKIGNLSVKLQFNAEENWTKALKFLLTNVKFILGINSVVGVIYTNRVGCTSSRNV
jgi:beclin 1